MKTCLIVDDSPFDRRLLMHCVESFGVASEQAATPKDALRMCAEKLPDCMLLDWEMPEMSGIDVLRKVRTMPHGDKVIIIICTSNDTFMHSKSAFAEGADNFIAKPVTVEGLEKKFKESGVLPDLYQANG